MPDKFSAHATSLESPASIGFPVTPHDTNALQESTRALYVGGTGSIVAVLVSGSEVTFTAVPAGTILPVRTSLIKATGTTATAIVGLL